MYGFGTGDIFFFDEVEYRHHEHHRRGHQPRSKIKAYSYGDTQAGAGPEAGGRRKAFYLARTCLPVCFQRKKAYAADDLRAKPGGICTAQPVVHVLTGHHDDASAQTNEHVCPKARGTPLLGTLQAKYASERGGEQHSEQDGPYGQILQAYFLNPIKHARPSQSWQKGIRVADMQ
jgi:hypothetical protein